MMQLELSFEKRAEHFIQIKVSWDTGEEPQSLIGLPLWRPGRYESTNFAGSIYGFQVWAGEDLVEATMINHYQWRFEPITGRITLKYRVLANQLNAGSSYVDANVIYLNPINWMVYPIGCEAHPVVVDFSLPGGFDAYPLSKELDGHFQSLHELLDTPVLAGKNLKKIPYAVGDYTFEHIVLGKSEGFVTMTSDFEKFTKIQIDMMGSLPVDHYRFLTLAFSSQSYHGVEHSHGCVMTYGPYFNLNQRSAYLDFIGLASHELFHAWNVKNFRSKDHTPYQYDRQVASEMGYVLEGFTTYYGDLFLIRAGVMTMKEYLMEWKKLLDRHLVNFGRYNLSLHEASRQTWVDGYQKGSADRKISIYNEGAIFAFLLDFKIRMESNQEHSLDNVLKMMYETYTPEHGYTDQDVVKICSDLAGIELDDFFTKHLDQADDWTDEVIAAMQSTGIDVSFEPDSDVLAAYWGIKIAPNGRTIASIHPLSPVLHEGIAVGDEVQSIGEVNAPSQFSAYCAFWKGHHLKWTVKNLLGEIREVNFRNARDPLYQQSAWKLKSDVNLSQKKWLKNWLSQG